MSQLESLTNAIEMVRNSPLKGKKLRQFAMQSLSQVHGYDWCGIYALEGEVLQLDEFVGAKTEHIRIPIGVGVCGAAVQENANQVVEDVHSISNYLACSTAAKSEIVVLIRRNGRIFGQIDVDSHRRACFGKDDEAHLEQIAELLAERWDD